MALAFSAGVTANNATGSAVTGAFGVTTVIGQLIVLTIVDDSAGLTSVTSVTDNKGNTYTRIATPLASTATMQMWYAVLSAAGSGHTITVAWSTAATGRVAVAAQYFDGFTGTPTLDQARHLATGSSVTANPGTTGTTTDANEIIIIGAGHGGTTSAFSLGAGFTNLSTVNVANAAVGQESKIVSSTGTQTGTMTIAASRTWQAGIATFKDVVTANTLTMPVIVSTTTMYAPTLSQKAESLTDNFNDNSLDLTNWTKSFSFDGTQVLEQNSRIEITHAATAQYNALATLNAYDLTGSYFTVKITDVGNQALVSHEVIFSLYKDNNNKVYFDINQNVITAYKIIAGVQTAIGSSLAYNSSTHQAFRFIESGGTLNLDTYDGSSWTNRWSLSNPWAVTALQALLQTGIYSAEASGSRAYFDDFNTGIIPPQSLTMPQITSTETMYQPTLTTGAVTITMPLISSTVVYAPTIVPAAVTITLPLIASTETLYTFSITTGVTIITPLISSTVVYAPTLVPGPVGITVPLIAATSAVYAPTLRQNVTTPLISGTVVYAPTVSPGAVAVVLPALGPATAVFAPVLRQTVSTGFIASTTILYAPDVGIPAAPIATSFIASTTTLYQFNVSVQGPVITMSSFLQNVNVMYAPTITPGAVTIVMPRIASTLVMNTQLLALYLKPGTIASTVVMYPFVISRLNVPLTTWTVADPPQAGWTPTDPGGAATWTPDVAPTADWDPVSATDAAAWSQQDTPVTSWEVRA